MPPGAPPPLPLARRLRERLRNAALIGLGRVLPGPDERAVAELAPGARVLLIRPDHLGDMLLATPAFHWLRDRLPAATIHLACGPWARDVLRGNSDLDAIIEIDFPGFSRGGPRRTVVDPYRQLRREARRLRAGEYDAAFVLRFDHWWGAMLAKYAGIPRRVGYALPVMRPFLSAALPYCPGLPEPVQNLRLLAGALEASEPAAAPTTHPLRFHLDPADAAWAMAWLDERRLQRVVVIHPASGAPVKRYPAERFARVVDGLAEAGLATIMTGAPPEQVFIDAIAARCNAPIVQLVGESLGRVAAVLARACLAIGVDSGILHLAVAVGTPTVTLYGPVDSRTFGPWGDPVRHQVLKADLPCLPCNRLDYGLAELEDHPCIRMIPADDVLAAAQILLERARAPRD